MKILQKYIKITLFLAATILSTSFFMNAQETEIDLNKPFSKHEVGFSVGTFPTIGLFNNDESVSFSNTNDPVFKHNNEVYENGNYEKMCHLGSYTLNYNYHFDLLHSFGVSLSWVGKHYEKKWVYSGYIYPDRKNHTETVDGKGWKHYFTLQGNYRITYFQKKDISLFMGLFTGVSLCLVDKNLLPKEKIHVLLGSISNDTYYFLPAMHFNYFGYEVGEKNVLTIELGIGTQGLLKIGYRYKFKN